MTSDAYRAFRAAEDLPLTDPPQSTQPTAQGSATAGRSPHPWPEPLRPEALHGLAGRVVKLIEPHTEADSAAVLIQFLVAFGSVVGRSGHAGVEGVRHYANLFAVIVGLTSKGRKGTSWGQVGSIMRDVDAGWGGSRIRHGLSSGEGLIYAVRDPSLKREPIRKKKAIVGYQDVESDAGESDKRLLVVEGEFASTLKVLGREGNTLSAVIRTAWDTGDLESLVKNSPCRATGAHVSIIGHITKVELHRHLESTEAANGFGNRFLWFCARRSKLLPEGGLLDETARADVVEAVRQAYQAAQFRQRIVRDENARRAWCTAYENLSDGKPGLLGAILGRAEAQVLRLSLIYALLDRSDTIRIEHHNAAMAVWEYAVASAMSIFGDSLGDPVADDILRALREAPAGIKRSAIRDMFQRHVSSTRLDTALDALSEAGLASSVAIPTSGRPAEMWLAGTAAARKAPEAPKGGGSDTPLTAHTALTAQGAGGFDTDVDPTAQRPTRSERERAVPDWNEWAKAYVARVDTMAADGGISPDGCEAADCALVAGHGGIGGAP